MLTKLLMLIACYAAAALLATRSQAAPAGTNYDESKIPPYTLPEIGRAHV